MGRDINVDILTFLIKTIIINFCMYYTFNKITNKSNKNSHQTIIFTIFNIIISIAQTFIEYKSNSVMAILTIYFTFGVFLGRLTNSGMALALVATAISYAICYIILLISAMINFLPYRLIYKFNYYLNTASVMILQCVLLNLFFKIRRFKNGFAFLNDKLNSDAINNFVTFLSVLVLLTTALMGILFKFAQYVKYDIIMLFALLGIAMYMMIHKTLAMQYKQTQLIKTMEEYKNEIEEKDKEIEKLRNEKYNTSKIRHEFYHRQKALELMVMSQYNNNTEISDANQNVLEIINNLTDEYSRECEKIKAVSKLDKTDIIEIDSMFKYMQNECLKYGIDFKLKIIGSIHPLINNIISKARLETLLGDHIKDAINAVNNENVTKKEIFVVLGVKDECYELVIYDTGKEFDIETLVKLGKKATTTYKNKGGSGIGFMTTFETLNLTKASLIIKEFANMEENYYTKSITIRFDGRHEYVVSSYRSNEIILLDKDNRIKVE